MSNEDRKALASVVACVATLATLAVLWTAVGSFRCNDRYECERFPPKWHLLGMFLSHGFLSLAVSVGRTADDDVEPAKRLRRSLHPALAVLSGWACLGTYVAFSVVPRWPATVHSTLGLMYVAVALVYPFAKFAACFVFPGETVAGGSLAFLTGSRHRAFGVGLHLVSGILCLTGLVVKQALLQQKSMPLWTALLSNLLGSLLLILMVLVPYRVYGRRPV